jgi:aryl-alcohol dehydrogenase-like predicted oxidoreductase
MTFGEDWGWGASRLDSRAIFDAYTAAGGNFIDTACNYTNGTSEKFVGEFIASDRDHFVVATKFTLNERKDDPNFGGNHKKNLIRSVEGSLKRLGVDMIDLLYLHIWDGTVRIEEIMRALDDLTRSGKILHIGISDSPAWIMARANTLAELRGWTQFTALQVPYSLAYRTVERDLIPAAGAFDMAILTWGVLEAGELTGKYNQPTGEPTRSKEADPRNKALAAEVMTLAAEIDRTPSQVAINWVRQQPGRPIPILGARRLSHIQDNLGCLEFELSPAQLQRLSDAAPIDLGFPHTFLAEAFVRQLIFGETEALIDRD